MKEHRQPAEADQKVMQHGEKDYLDFYSVKTLEL